MLHLDYRLSDYNSWSHYFTRQWTISHLTTGFWAFLLLFYRIVTWQYDDDNDSKKKNSRLDAKG